MNRDDIPRRQLSDRDALRRIQAALDGREWTPDTLDEIADAVRQTGRVVRSTDDVRDEDEDE